MQAKKVKKFSFIQGHFARECPNKKEKKSGCFKCGEEGHNKADCPNAGEGKTKKKYLRPEEQFLPWGWVGPILKKKFANFEKNH